jgi:DNA-binding transcriptional MerR regulator
MRIKELSEKHGVDKRTIDYWTNKGLLHPIGELNGFNGYRNYQKRDEENVKLILILKLTGRKVTNNNIEQLRAALTWGGSISKMIRSDVLEERDKVVDRYNKLISFIDGYRGS